MGLSALDPALSQMLGATAPGQLREGVPPAAFMFMEGHWQVYAGLLYLFVRGCLYCLLGKFEKPTSFFLLLLTSVLYGHAFTFDFCSKMVDFFSFFKQTTCKALKVLPTSLVHSL